MFKDLKDAINPHITISDYKKTYLNIKNFRLNWIQRTPEHIDFLGTNLMGVYSLRFTIPDEDLWYLTLDVDKKQLQQDIYQTKGIIKSMKTISSAFYNLSVYLMHLYTTGVNTGLKEHEKTDAIKEIFFVMVYKMTGSINSQRFKYPCPPEIAKAAHERLSNKFLLKRFNSWQEVFDYKTLDVLPKGIHYPRLIKYNTDNANRIISDIQTKLRDIYRNVYSIIMEIKDDNTAKIKSTSLLKEGDDEEGYNGITNREDKYISYLTTNIRSYNDIYNEDIINLLLTIYTVLTKPNVEKVLKYFTDNYDNNKDIKEIVEKCVPISIAYLTRKEITCNYTKHIYDIIIALKGYFGTTKTKDESTELLNKTMTHIKTAIYGTQSISFRQRKPVFNMAILILSYFVVLAFLSVN